MNELVSPELLKKKEEGTFSEVSLNLVARPVWGFSRDPNIVKISLTVSRLH